MRMEMRVHLQELDRRSTVDRDVSAGRYPSWPVIAALASSIVWVSAASAGPAVIVAPRVEVVSAPSPSASVVSELPHGAQVCVLDRSNDPGVLFHRLGWLAIRIPHGVGYVPVEAVDLAAPALGVEDCGAAALPPAGAGAQARDPERPPQPRTSPMAVVPRPSTGQSEPDFDRPALIAGGFLPLRPARFLIGIGTGLARISDETAMRHHLGDQGLTLHGTIGFTIYDVFMMSASAAAAFPSDSASFSETVVPVTGGGDPESADSSLSVVSYSVAVGLRTPFWALHATDTGWVAAALFTAYGTAGFHGGRSIANCVDCRSDELEIPGGTFWQAGIEVVGPTRRRSALWGLTVAYQRFATGAGFFDEVRVGLGLWL